MVGSEGTLGFVASVDGFTRQPWVMNGASELLIKLFSDRGKHARSAIGTNQLPMDIPVEVEIVPTEAAGGVALMHLHSSTPLATLRLRRVLRLPPLLSNQCVSKTFGKTAH